MTREQREVVRTALLKAYRDEIFTPEQKRLADRLMWDMRCADMREKEAA